MMTLSWGTPNALISSVQLIDAAPAPFTTTFRFFMSRPVSSAAFSTPAAAMIAVPCWSS